MEDYYLTAQDRVIDQELLTDQELYLFHQGTHYHSYLTFGSHPLTLHGKDGYRFVVWAPHAECVGVVGDFNNWNAVNHQLQKVNTSGVWAGFIPSLGANERYKYEIITRDGQRLLKADPYAFFSETRPKTASLTSPMSSYSWNDQQWQKSMSTYNPYESPMLIYEVHLGTWKKKKNGQFYTYREFANEFIPYVKELGYTHIELLPLSEHPFDRSWGYQITGYYSITSRYGTPDDFRYFIDQCHQNGIGVIMDWVPGHFCKDDHGLRLFDGSPIFEYSDPHKAEKSGWGTLTFDFGKPEVQSFLISNAIFWFKEFHIDGLRVDAVASMLYLNFDKQDGEEKIFNTYGGEENLEAIAFIRKLNETVYSYFPNALMTAEESSSWPLVSAPTYTGGLGFNFKWNMGWMNDMLEYMEMDPVHRKWHHSLITFSFMYAFSENFILPLSHDEVVHGKRSLLNKMPGDQWQQFAQLRLLYGYMITHPGKKLLFMGGEFGQHDEWKDLDDLDWNLLDFPMHDSMHQYVKSLNTFYKEEPALYVLDHSHDGFSWIDPHDHDQSIISFIRNSRTPDEKLIVICNFTPVVKYDYKVGVPEPGTYIECFNSDDQTYGGSGQLNKGKHFSIDAPWHGHDQHIQIKLPPLAFTIFKIESTAQKGRKKDE